MPSVVPLHFRYICQARSVGLSHVLIDFCFLIAWPVISEPIWKFTKRFVLNIQKTLNVFVKWSSLLQLRSEVAEARPPVVHFGT